MNPGTDTWFANRNFKGLDVNGKPKDFTLGDPIPNVQNWPTFVSLKNTNWIVAASPLKKTAEPKSEKVKPVAVVEKKSEQPAPVKAKAVKEPAQPKKAKEQTKTVEAATDDLKCNLCAKYFKSSRALKVHLRYH